MTVYGYCRVSTKAQTVDGQWDALIAAGVHPDCIGIEYASGAAPRPKLVSMVERMEAGDVLTVWRLDRLGRGLRDLHELLDVLANQQCTLRSLSEGLDTQGTAGRLLLHLLSAIAEWERETIRERAKMGLKAAMARGVKVGRPRALTPVERRAALAYAQQGMTQREIGRLLNCSEATVWRTLKELRGK